MNLYERHVLPYAIDCACGLPAVRRKRAAVVPLAAGRVLEIGIGTGRNIPHYDPAKVARVVGIDPAAQMHPLARRRMRRAGIAVELMALSAERIPLPDASFDTAVVTYSLCTIPDPVAALAEVRRLLVPGGRLLFCEHGRAPDEGVRRWQRRLQPLWGPLAGGCQLGRDIPALLEAGGFAATDMKTGYIPGPRFATYHYWGSAAAADRPGESPKG